MIFESILATFKLSSIFGGSWGSNVNWLELKIEPPSGNLAFPNPRNAQHHTPERGDGILENSQKVTSKRPLNQACLTQNTVCAAP
jgi:hypothetical protein